MGLIVTLSLLVDRNITADQRARNTGLAAVDKVETRYISVWQYAPYLETSTRPSSALTRKGHHELSRMSTDHSTKQKPCGLDLLAQVSRLKEHKNMAARNNATVRGLQ